MKDTKIEIDEEVLKDVNLGLNYNDVLVVIVEHVVRAIPLRLGLDTIFGAERDAVRAGAVESKFEACVPAVSWTGVRRVGIGADSASAWLYQLAAVVFAITLSAITKRSIRINTIEFDAFFTTIFFRQSDIQRVSFIIEACCAIDQLASAPSSAASQTSVFGDEVSGFLGTYPITCVLETIFRIGEGSVRARSVESEGSAVCFAVALVGIGAVGAAGATTRFSRLPSSFCTRVPSGEDKFIFRHAIKFCAFTFILFG